jgi:hypothetical protein
MHKSLLNQFIDSSDDPILVLHKDPEDTAYRVVYYNPSYLTKIQSLLPQRLKEPFDLSSLSDEDKEPILYAIYERTVVHKEIQLNIDVTSHTSKELIDSLVTPNNTSSNPYSTSNIPYTHNNISINDLTPSSCTLTQYLYIHGYPMNAKYYVLLIRNITEHYCRNEDIKKSKNLLEGLFESSFNALVITTLDGSIIKFNRRFYAHLLTKYEYNFSLGLNKGYVWDLPCFDKSDMMRLREFYKGSSKVPMKVGEFFFTPYLGDKTTSLNYVLCELRLDHIEATKESALASLEDSGSRLLLNNLESDVIRLQKRVFEDKDSVVSRLDTVLLDIRDMKGAIEDVQITMAPLKDLNALFRMCSWASTNLPIKTLTVIIVGWLGLTNPFIENKILEYLFDITPIELNTD